ncbi:MAG: fibrinogen-like YCDxxxxGGGW domain-containing protein [Polyangiales bacterium]
MARPATRLTLLLLAMSACSLEHPIARALDVEDPGADLAAVDEPVDDRPDSAADDVVDASTPDVVRLDVVDAGRDVADVADAPPGHDVVDGAAPTDAMDVPALPDVTDVPALPDAMDVPALPDAVDVPVLPDVVDVPALPDAVDVPALPDVVDVPALPDVIDAGPPVYESCEAVRLMGLPSGAYWIRAGATTPWRAYCDTTEAGGAWTLVLKADGRLRTFAYDAALWTNTTLLNETSANLDRVEAKFSGFNTLPARAVRLQLISPADSMAPAALRALVLDALAGAPLQRVFQNAAFVDLASRGNEDFWMSMVPNSRMQDRCNRRGFNARANNQGAGRVRIGMIGNENYLGECDSHDSWVGVGGTTGSCGEFDNNTVGNAACFAGSGNARDIRSFAYVWVR